MWHGDGFAAPDHVVFVPPAFMDLRPFVYAVPAELLAFSDLLSGAGVAQTARLVDVLNKVARPPAAALCYDTIRDAILTCARKPT